MAKQSGGGHQQASIAGMVIIRIALGAFFLFDGISKLTTPQRFVGVLGKASANSGAYMPWSVSQEYAGFLKHVVHPHAEVYAWVIMLLGVLAGALLLVGFLTRLAGLFGLLISVFFLLAMWAGPQPNFYFYTALAVMSAATVISAAGRTFGFDALLAAKTKVKLLW